MGPRAVAEKILARIERDEAHAAALLAAELTGLPDERDRGLATELVFGVLRHRSHLDRLLDGQLRQGLASIPYPVLGILRLALEQLAFLTRIPPHAVIHHAVEATRRAGFPGLTGLVNAVLRRLAAGGPEGLAPLPLVAADLPATELAVRAGLPGWLLARLIADRGLEPAIDIARAFDDTPPRILRVNRHRISRDEAIVRANGRPGRLSPIAVETDDRQAAHALEEAGVVLHQDEGSQLVALAVDPRPGERVLDACAGRGGKTGALASLAPGVTLVAADRHTARLERLRFEATRQGFDVTTHVVDLAASAGPLDGQRFDRVLVDAPCTGSGTLGRRPEIRWRLKPEDAAALATVQSRILDTVAPLVRPGGRLVYAVCSLLEAEGEGQLLPFLARHSAFSLVTRAPAEWPAAVDWNGGVILLDPARHRTDGYVIIILERSR